MFRIGGIRLALAATIVLLLAPVALALALARRRGASAASIVPFALLPILDFSSILRAQLFSQLLFVVLLGLLLAESRRRSRRIMLAFPLLALWANLHGAALVGAVLVSLLGLHELRTRRTIRAFALVVAPWPCLVATPYGLATVGYYRGLFGNPVIRAIETEWRAPTFASVMGFALFVLAGAAVALVARRPRDLNPFELGVLAFTLVGAMLAVRSIPWFAYACLVLLPPLVERTWRRRPLQATPTALGLVVAITAGAAASAALLLAVKLLSRSAFAAVAPR
jgi:hypothetical protein